MTDVSTTIDNALGDKTVSLDAMRWEPAWDEPVVQAPASIAEWLMMMYGLDGYAATIAARERSFARFAQLTGSSAVVSERQQL